MVIQDHTPASYSFIQQMLFQPAHRMPGTAVGAAGAGWCLVQTWSCLDLRVSNKLLSVWTTRKRRADRRHLRQFIQRGALHFSGREGCSVLIHTQRWQLGGHVGSVQRPRWAARTLTATATHDPRRTRARIGNQEWKGGKDTVSRNRSEKGWDQERDFSDTGPARSEQGVLPALH